MASSSSSFAIICVFFCFCVFFSSGVSSLKESYVELSSSQSDHYSVTAADKEAKVAYGYNSGITFNSDGESVLRLWRDLKNRKTISCATNSAGVTCSIAATSVVKLTLKIATLQNWDRFPAFKTSLSVDSSKYPIDSELCELPDKVDVITLKGHSSQIIRAYFDTDSHRWICEAIANKDQPTKVYALKLEYGEKGGDLWNQYSSSLFPVASDFKGANWSVGSEKKALKALKKWGK